MRRRRRRFTFTITLAVVGALVVVLLAWFLRTGPEPEPAAAPSDAPPASTEAPAPPPCTTTATAPFTPTSVTVPGAIEAADVLPVPPVGEVSGTLPESEGRAFAWEPSPGATPGSAQGNVLLNVHTFPGGGANGNVLLDELQVGGQVVLTGTAPDGSAVQLCYVVSERLEMAATELLPRYYATDGPPQVAIVVCSGERRGPGDWSHRTVWFASPVGA